MCWDHHILQKVGPTCLRNSRPQVFVLSRRSNFTRSFDSLSWQYWDETCPHPSDDVITHVKDDTSQKRKNKQVGKKANTVVMMETAVVTRATSTLEVVVMATAPTKKRAAPKKRKAAATPARATKKRSACDSDWTEKINIVVFIYYYLFFMIVCLCFYHDVCVASSHPLLRVNMRVDTLFFDPNFKVNLFYHKK
jgi:hypothetical protein